MTCTFGDWLAADWHRCIISPVPTLIGEPLFGLMVGGGIWVSFYFAAGGRSLPPTVVTILLSGLLFPILPGNFVGIAYGALFIGASAAILQVLQKYVLNPATA